MVRSVPAPVEADGWRVAQDPAYNWLYWRYRALVLEYAIWFGALARRAEWGEWRPYPREPLAVLPTTEREQVWQALFLNP